MRILAVAWLLAAAFAAPPDPVHWKLEGAPARPVKPGARFTVRLVARVEPGWHLYGMKPVADGPIPTRVWLPEGAAFALAGGIQATDPETVHDPSFDMEVEIYEGEASFVLPVKAAGGAPAGAQTLSVKASYQSCNNKICLPPKTVTVEAPVTITK
jgi:thiol:disulfide interchange protein DsbD